MAYTSQNNNIKKEGGHIQARICHRFLSRYFYEAEIYGLSSMSYVFLACKQLGEEKGQKSLYRARGLFKDKFREFDANVITPQISPVEWWGGGGEGGWGGGAA